MSNADQNLSETARILVDELSRQNMRIVFAESCTGGLVAATLTQISGVSNWFCGSAVTYQEETKQAWLEVAKEELNEFTAVSEEVTKAMVVGVLGKTSQADLAVAVTGHLGPGAPAEIDGVVFLACSQRHRPDREVRTRRIQLTLADRRSRQIEAAEATLRFALNCCSID